MSRLIHLNDGLPTIGVLTIRQTSLSGAFCNRILKRGNVWRLNSKEKMQRPVSGAR
jgi:hypothetical protein